MKLHAALTRQYQTDPAYDGDRVENHAVHFDYCRLVVLESQPVAWPVASFDALSAADFERIRLTNPGVVFLGTGAHQRFVHPRLTVLLSARRIDIQSTDREAACRTYRIMSAESRNVTQALPSAAKA